MIAESTRYDRTMRALAATLAPLVLGACASFGADTNGGGGTDAGTDAPSVTEAGVDDGGGGDGGKEAGNGFCAKQSGALFCADFEDGTTNVFTSTSLASPSAGNFNVVNMGGSAVLHATFQATQGPLHLYFDQVLAKSLVEPVAIEADIFLAKKLTAGQGQYSFLGFYTSTSGTQYTLDFFGQADDHFSMFTQTPGGATSNATAGWQTGTWVSMRALVDPTTMTGDVFAATRGQPLTKISTLTPSAPGGTPKPPLRLLVGVQNYGNTPPTPALDVYWDNIVVRKQ